MNIAIGDEMFSDTYPLKLVENCVYEITAKVSSVFSKMFALIVVMLIILSRDVELTFINHILLQHISRTQDDIQLEGSNASAEEADEGTDAASESGLDIVLNHRLCETGFGSKKDYTTYLKDYMKKVVKYLEENDMKDQVDSFKTNITTVMKSLLGKYKDLQFYTG